MDVKLFSDLSPVKRIFLQKHEPIKFFFKSTPETFYVDEIPSIKFSGKGNTLVLHIKKSYLSTWDLIDLIYEELDIPKKLIGYAGLKDKHATTTQYISVPKIYEHHFKDFSHKNVTILKTYLHHSGLNIGDLKGNHFTITLEKVSSISAGKIEKVLKKITNEGLANYFGYQRFGREDKAVEDGKAILYDDKHITDKRLEKFLISAYSSHLFNAWLAKRIELSNREIAFLEGDIFINLQNGKFFTPAKLKQVSVDFRQHKITLSGLISGTHAIRAQAQAGELEASYDDITVTQKALRRAAFVFLSDESFTYKSVQKEAVLEFTLPKSSYATVVLENISLQ